MRVRNCPTWNWRAEAISTNREMLGERLLHGGSLNHRKIEIADGKCKILARIDA